MISIRKVIITGTLLSQKDKGYDPQRSVVAVLNFNDGTWFDPYGGVFDKFQSDCCDYFARGSNNAFTTTMREQFPSFENLRTEILWE
jgi:hypothetical protein